MQKASILPLKHTPVSLNGKRPILPFYMAKFRKISPRKFLAKVRTCVQARRQEKQRKVEKNVEEVEPPSRRENVLKWTSYALMATAWISFMVSLPVATMAKNVNLLYVFEVWVPFTAFIAAVTLNQFYQDMKLTRKGVDTSKIKNFGIKFFDLE